MDFNENFLKNRAKLLELGIDPYPYSFEITHRIKDIILDEEQLKEKEISTAGRIISIREMGKACFATIEDFDSKIQIYIKKDTVGDKTWNVFKLLNPGDIIGVSGQIFRTKTGELTVYIKILTVLAKTVVEIPFGKSTDEKTYYKVKDIEIKYRERYIDWITDKQSRDRFLLRSKIISEIRKIMGSRGFIEVETPILSPVYGGAEARPFETTVHMLSNQKVFLSISPELYLKRFIVGGFPKVYTICKNFRNEGLDRNHNPEFTMMEYYETYTDYIFQMKQFETLIAELCNNLFGTTIVNYQGTKLDFTPPWKRMTMIDAIETISNVPVTKMSDPELEQFCKEHEIPIEGNFSRGIATAEIFDILCADKLIQPVFIHDYPKEISPLTKTKRGNSNLVERFEAFVLGMELGNAYSELTDPVEQLERFTEQKELQKKKNIDFVVYPLDTDFIKAIGCGMPPTGGVGIGIDRLVMILTDSSSIRDIIAFPLLKQKEEE